MESVGIKDNTKFSTEDEIMISGFNKAVEYKDNKYYVELPWKTPRPKLLDNIKAARGQLYQNYSKLKNTGNLDAYHKQLMDQLDKGFIEEVTDEPFKKHQCHYLTHRPVFRDDSATTKMRIVYNCSKKDSNAVSLNDCLMEGPNLVADLTKVLLNFRLDKFCLMSDIKKAFLMVQLKNEFDKNHLRFLWFKDPHDINKGMKTFRFKVVLFGANCSPCLLAQTVKTHLNNQEDSLTTQFLKKNMYVDNLIGSTCNENELIEIYENSKEIMATGNFSLQEWISNSEVLNKKIENDEIGLTEKSQFIKALGMLWHLDTVSNVHDTLCTRSYKLNIDAKTKRNILAESSKIFDPLGLLSPATIRARIFLQELWKKKLDWDEDLSEEDLGCWKKLAKDLEKLQKIKIPRMIGFRNVTQELHIFCDASSLAYGCCAYLVSQEMTSLVYAKSKVAPIKPKRSIPQLELLALTLGVKIVTFLVDTLSELTFENIYLWSDSQVALTWVAKTKSISCKTVFIKNRLLDIENEIEKLNCSLHYCYVKTAENPADFLTRGLSFKLLKSNKNWFKGPKWLPHHEEWLGQQDTLCSNILATDPEKVEENEPILNYKKFSCYKKLIRVISYCCKLLNKYLSVYNPDKVIKDPTERAKKYWISYVQKMEFPEAVDFFDKKSLKKDVKVPTPVMERNIYIDDNNLMRCDGRIGKSELSYGAKYPILLPRNNHLTKLIIEKIHDD